MKTLRRPSHRPFYVLAGGGLLWGCLVSLTGGLSLEAYGIPFSSREPVRALVLSAVSGCIAMFLHLGPTFRVSAAALAKAGACGIAVAVGAVLWLTIDRGSFVAGGADSSGYLSQARLWQQGLPRVPQPLALELPWPEAELALTPLAFCPCAKRDELVPVPAQGYPLAMAATRAVFGPGAEFSVVPVAAAGLVLCTYLLGATLWGTMVGLLAAVLLATSPPFLLQAFQPMSDVPAAFWWTLALTLGLSRRPASVVAAAAATAMAIATRPNMAPIGPLLAALLFVIQRSGAAAVPVHRFAWRSVFAGTIGGALFVAILNNALYGSPLSSGYGGLADLYSAGNVLPNLSRYGTWLVSTETPLIAIVLLSPLITPESSPARRVRWYGILVGVMVMASYLPWKLFDIWHYLRFLLIAYPLMYLLLVSGCVIPRLRDGWLRRWLPVIVFAVVGFTHAKELVAKDVFAIANFERRYRTVGEYVDRTVPRKAVVLSMQQSGSVNYYSGRQILRYDYLDPDWLERAVELFEGKGMKCYAVLEDWEVVLFRDRFQTASPLGRLDWRPLIVIEDISVYELRPPD